VTALLAALLLTATPGCPEAAAGLDDAARLHCRALADAPRLPRASEAERRLLAGILDRPEFRRARADPEPLRRLLLALWGRMLALLETGEAQAFAGFSRALFLAAAAAAALLWLWALRRGRAAPRPRPPVPGAAGVDAPADAGLGAARQAAARGDGRAAVRLAFLAALAALERDGAVPPGRALTNGELAALVARRGGVAGGPLAALAGLFDRTVYGGRPAGAAEAAAAVEAARALGAGREA
jgi:hypothetical protein